MTLACAHCGEPAAPALYVERENRRLPVCCPGCAGAMALVHELGLDTYYRLRTGGASPPIDDNPDERERQLALFRSPELLSEHESVTPEGRRLTLALSGLHCAACCWLIEKAAAAIPGVSAVGTDLAAMELTLTYQDAGVPAAVAERLNRLGYGVSLPGDPRGRDQRRREERRLLGRLALAGIGAMQAMMYSAALYIGVFDGGDQVYLWLFRWVGLLIATPVVFYAGWPFLQGAWRGLRAGSPGMDLPVALALLLAWGGSLVNMALGGEHVYFDSAAMFVFFLLLSRWLEQRQRHRVGAAWQQLKDALPLLVRRQADDSEHWVPSRRVVAGDLLRIGQGEVLPVDAVIVEGHAQVEQAALTGEPLPRNQGPGDTVQAGARLLEGSLRVRAAGPASDSLVARIADQVARARSESPPMVRDWRRVAPLFTAAVLALAGITFFLHSSAGPAPAFEHALAVLVVTCPCALALAVPLSVSGALGAALRHGILVASPAQLLAVTDLRGVLFDKTGTLTSGRFRVVQQQRLGEHGYSEAALLSIAAALEQHHPHPLARAFDAYPADPALCQADVLRHGAQGRRRGKCWGIGPDPDEDADDPAGPGGATRLLLSENGRPRLRLWLSDAPRGEAATVTAALREQGWRLRLASGDGESAVATLAGTLGLDDWRARQTPAQKSLWLKHLTAEEGAQMMVGDGINDAPALLAASVSVATADASTLARQAAGLYLLRPGLAPLAVLPALARRCRRGIRQNLIWALAYNLTAVPLAVAGLVPPWAAALGMSASSLLVTFNASRIARWQSSSC
jgi:Cu2+-exporting ATPase